MKEGGGQNVLDLVGFDRPFSAVDYQNIIKMKSPAAAFYIQNQKEVTHNELQGSL